MDARHKVLLSTQAFKRHMGCTGCTIFTSLASTIQWKCVIPMQTHAGARVGRSAVFCLAHDTARSKLSQCRKPTWVAFSSAFCLDSFTSCSCSSRFSFARTSLAFLATCGWLITHQS